MAVDLSAIGRLTERIRAWAPAILAAAAAADEEGDFVRQQRMRLRDTLQLLLTLRESLVLQKASVTSSQRLEYDTGHVLACMRLMMHVRNRATLPVTIARAFDAALPGLAESVGAERRLEEALPSPSVLSRNQVALDIALTNVLSRRMNAHADPPCLYILADSSPQCNFNFLLSTMVVVHKSNLVAAFRAACELAKLDSLDCGMPIVKPVVEEVHAGLASPDADDGAEGKQVEAAAAGLAPPEQDSGAWAKVIRRRAELARKLEDLIEVVTHMPMCLGAGAASLPTKVRLILHVLWTLCAPPRFRSLMGQLEHVVSFTTDMGVEVGLADFEAPSVRSVMAPWMFPMQHGARVLPTSDLGELAEGEHDEAHDPSQASKRTFPRALVIAGVLHIFHNLSWSMDSAMPYFTTWLNGLKAVVTLLHHRAFRELFVERCVRGTAFDRPSSRLKRGIPSATKEWRWGLVIMILRELLPLRVLLRCTFDAGKMVGATAVGESEGADGGQGGDEAPGKVREGRLDPLLIQKTVRDGKWWCFGEMLAALHHALSSFAEWCESCPCHWGLRHQSHDFLSAFTGLQTEAGADTQFDGAHYQCPLAGLRAPELAAGDWRRVLDDMCTKRLDAFLEDLTADSLDHVHDIVSDFEEGKNMC